MNLVLNVCLLVSANVRKRYAHPKDTWGGGGGPAGLGDESQEFWGG